MSNERWLTDGDCTKCRMQSYCNKSCTACKPRREKELFDLVHRAMQTKVAEGSIKTDYANDEMVDLEPSATLRANTDE